MALPYFVDRRLKWSMSKLICENNITRNSHIETAIFPIFTGISLIDLFPYPTSHRHQQTTKNHHYRLKELSEFFTDSTMR